MNSDQLRCAIREDRCLSDLVVGVFPSDEIPRDVHSRPAAYVFNTDPARLPGKHWIVVWFRNSSRAEFYDSLGRPPGSYGTNFVNFVTRNADTCVYNNVPVQSEDKDTCGYHVLFYLLAKCRGVDMSSIVDGLKGLDDPDEFVYDYVRKYFRCI